MIKQHKILIFAIVFYLLLVSIVLIVSESQCQWHFSYALDDPYIHMAMAKNLVTHGSWAVNQMNFSSSSSSPLWVVIISGVYYLAGVNVTTPFILNILFQIFCLIIAYSIFKNYGLSKYLFFALLALIFITPMPAILFGGMEHSAQTAFALMFVFFSTKLIVNEEKKSSPLKYLLFITPVLTAFRYESMFLVAVVVFILLIRKKFLYALILFALGLLPIIIYGIFSTSHGWLFLPNTIFLKSTAPELSSVGILKFLTKAIKNITLPHIFIMLVISSFIYVFHYKKHKELWTQKQVFLLITILTTIINMSMIEYHTNGAFYRYEAYLMALNTVAIIISLYSFIPDLLSLLNRIDVKLYRHIIYILLIAVITPLIIRAYTVFEVPIAVREYHNQQYQMAQFIKEYEPGITVAANDIGMISYYTENKVVDLWGVANIDVAKAMLSETYTTKTISEISTKENVRLAVLYEHWFDEFGGVPANWIKIGEWTMTDKSLFLGFETVTFYCMNKDDAESFKKKLGEYSAGLPKSVIYKVY